MIFLILVLVASSEMKWGIREAASPARKTCDDSEAKTDVGSNTKVGDGMSPSGATEGLGSRVEHKNTVNTSYILCRILIIGERWTRLDV